MIRRIIKIILVAACTLQGSSSFSQIMSGRVVSQGVELPFVHVYQKGTSNGVVTNMEGEFSIEPDTLSALLIFSHINYQTLEIEVSSSTETLSVELIPKDVWLDPVIILSDNAETLVKEAFQKGVRESKNKTNSTLFYRQIVKVGQTPIEVVEAFFSGVISCAGIEELRLINGRYAEIKGDSGVWYLTVKNFYYLSQIPVIQQKIRETILPLNKDFNTYYQCQVREVISSENDKPIAVVAFEPLSSQKANFKGDVYIDVETRQVLRMVGSIVGDNGPKFESEKFLTRNPEWQFDISFYSSGTGSSPLLSVIKNDVKFDCITNGKSAPVQVSSYMVAFEYNNASHSKSKSKKLKYDQSLVSKIKNTSKDNQFWYDNPVVKRTQHEQEVIDLFESLNLFNSLSGTQ